MCLNWKIILFILNLYWIDKLDEEVKQDGITILIDKKAQLSLLGTDICLICF